MEFKKNFQRIQKKTEKEEKRKQKTPQNKWDKQKTDKTIHLNKTLLIII